MSHVHFLPLICGRKNEHGQAGITFPPLCGGLFYDRVRFWAESQAARALPPIRPSAHGGSVLVVLGGQALDLAGRNLADYHGSARAFSRL